MYTAIKWHSYPSHHNHFLFLWGFLSNREWLCPTQKGFTRKPAEMSCSNGIFHRTSLYNISMVNSRSLRGYLVLSHAFIPVKKDLNSSCMFNLILVSGLLRTILLWRSCLLLIRGMTCSVCLSIGFWVFRGICWSNELENCPIAWLVWSEWTTSVPSTQPEWLFCLEWAFLWILESCFKHSSCSCPNELSSSKDNVLGNASRLLKAKVMCRCRRAGMAVHKVCKNTLKALLR